MKHQRKIIGPPLIQLWLISERICLLFIDSLHENIGLDPNCVDYRAWNRVVSGNWKT